MDGNPIRKLMERFRGVVQWQMMEAKDFLTNISWQLRNENENSVSFQKKAITFRISITEFSFL